METPYQIAKEIAVGITKKYDGQNPILRSLQEKTRALRTRLAMEDMGLAENKRYLPLLNAVETYFRHPQQRDRAIQATAEAIAKIEEQEKQ